VQIGTGSTHRKDRGKVDRVDFPLMSRRNRLAALVALALVFVATASVLATRAPQAPDEPTRLAQDGEDVPPTAEDLAHAAERLAANDLEVSDDLLAELAAEYGVGGAVRVVAWSAGDPERMADIREKRDGVGTEGGGMGWGQIAKDLGVDPGIGSIMGQGGGHGRDNAPGQQGD
jgi:hypothetical protein